MTLPPSRQGGDIKVAADVSLLKTVGGWGTTYTEVKQQTNCDERYTTAIECNKCSDIHALKCGRQQAGCCKNSPWRAPGVAAVVDPCGGEPNV